jgi:hypothetical protein
VIYSFYNNLYAPELGNKMEAQREATFRLYYTNNTQYMRIRLIGLVIGYKFRKKKTKCSITINIRYSRNPRARGFK